MILVAILLFIILIGALIYILSSVITPFLAAVCIAYALTPFMEWIKQAIKVSNSIASLIATALFFIFIITIIAILGPMIYYQIYNLIYQITANQTVISNELSSLADKLDHISPQIKEQFQNQLNNISDQLIQAIKVILKGIMQSGLIATNALSFAIIIPFVTFHLLKDTDIIKKIIYSVIPLKYQNDCKALLSSMQYVMIGFFRGQLAVCSILAIYYTFAFLVLGLNSWLGLGILYGTLIFVPYLGSLTATILCILIAINQFSFDYHLIILVISLLIGQLLEGMFLTPKLVGNSTNLHPIWIIFSLISGWSLAGFFGVLIAVPLAAILGVIFRFCLHKYRKSGFYNSNQNT